MEERNNLFPVFLKLRNLDTLLMGGGNVGLEKLEALLKNDPLAKVTIVSIDFLPEIEHIAQAKTDIKLIKRAFEITDLENRHLVVMATDQPKLHEEIKAICARRHILTNVADTPHLCDFYLGSTVTKGNLKIGISTNGQSPTFAKRFREVLEEILPEETNELLANLKGIRDRLRGDFSYKVKKLNEITSTLQTSE
ncbi:MAG: bifunctional precorrin-2 dehydrogenase/sirohydrochlorin ferrochelatase [Bacteroidota bacterium]